MKVKLSLGHKAVKLLRVVTVTVKVKVTMKKKENNMILPELLDDF